MIGTPCSNIIVHVCVQAAAIHSCHCLTLQFSVCKETLLNLLDGYSKNLKERVLPYAVEIKVRRGRSKYMATNNVAYSYK